MLDFLKKIPRGKNLASAITEKTHPCKSDTSDFRCAKKPRVFKRLCRQKNGLLLTKMRAESAVISCRQRIVVIHGACTRTLSWLNFFKQYSGANASPMRWSEQRPQLLRNPIFYKQPCQHIRAFYTYVFHKRGTRTTNIHEGFLHDCCRIFAKEDHNIA